MIALFDVVFEYFFDPIFSIGQGNRGFTAGHFTLVHSVALLITLGLLFAMAQFLLPLTGATSFREGAFALVLSFFLIYRFAAECVGLMVQGA